MNEFLNRFKDRRDAGRQLAAKLKEYKRHPGVLVLGLPRGGVVIADEVAKELDTPFEILLVRKLGVPWQRELAMGAVGEGGVLVLNPEIIEALDLSAVEIEKAAEEEKKEILRRQLAYRGHHAPPVVAGREVIVIDDGLATGATMKAAVQTLKKRGAKKIIVAVPVGDSETCREMGKEADKVICLSTPHPLQSIGQWYYDFQQVSENEVVGLLAKCRNKYLQNGYVKSEVIQHEKLA